MTLTISVLCEYLLSDQDRIKQAAFSAIRLLISYGLNQSYFDKQESKKSSITDILNLDMMTITEEVKNIRNERLSASQLSQQEKIYIQMCYLITSRFEEVLDLSLKLVKAFVEKVGIALKTQIGDFLVIVSEIKIKSKGY